MSKFIIEGGRPLGGVVKPIGNKNAILKIYAGAPHGLAYTHRDRLNADLLAFLRL